MPDQNDIQKALLDFSATIKAKPNLSTKEILQKFPEFDNQAFKINAAKDYARTMETKKYKTTEELNSKFPEFFGRGESKKTKSEEIVTPAGLQPGYKFPTIDTSLFQTTPRTIKESVDFGNTNAIDNTKIMDSYPAIKDQYIKDKTINNLLKKGKLPMENSNSWKDEYADVKATTTDEEWVPKNTMVINPEQTKINKDKLLKESIAQFSFNHNEDEKDIEQKIKNGDYVFENGKVKEKGGLSDMYGQDLTSAVDKVDLYLKVAAREADNPGNNNAIKYELKEYFKNKEKKERYTPDGWKGQLGSTLGGLTPLLVASAVGGVAARGVVAAFGAESELAGLASEALKMSDVPLMGMDNAASLAERIWQDPNLTDDQKVEAIKRGVVNGTMTGALQGVAFHAIGITDENRAKELLSKYTPTKKLHDTFKDILKTFPSDVSKAAAIGGSTELLNNLELKREGVKVDWSSVPQGALQMAAFHTIMTAPKIFLHGLKTLNESVRTGYDKDNSVWFNKYSKNVQDVLNEIVSSPEHVYNKLTSILNIHPDVDAKNALEKISTFRDYYKSLPSELSKNEKFKALHILQLKTEAMAESKKSTDIGLRNVWETKASAYDKILNKLLENAKGFDEEKEPLMLPRFAASYNKDDDEAKQYGFKDSKDFVESLNTRQGTNYTKYADIPEETKTKFTSELVPLKQPKLDTTIPDWFKKGTVTEGGAKVEDYATYKDIKKAFPELHEYLSSLNKERKKDGEWVNRLVRFDDDAILKHFDLINLSPIINAIRIKDSRDLAFQIKAAEQFETLLSYYDETRSTMTPEGVKQLLEKPGYRGKNKFSPEQVEIMKEVVDRIKTKNLFIYKPNVLGYESNDNFYMGSMNILKSKDPDAFVHEVGHWGYYNMLTPEDRIEFLRYMNNKFGTNQKAIAEGLVYGKIVTNELGGTQQTNVMDNIQEYFADQFRQYYYNNVLPEPKLKALFDKMKTFIQTLLGLYKEKGYNPELTKYFDKIIDVSKPEGEGVPIGKEGIKEQVGKKKVEPLWYEDPKKEKQEIKKQNEIAKSFYKEFPKVKEGVFISSITSDETGHYSNIKIELRDTSSWYGTSPKSIEKTKEWAKSHGLEYVGTTEKEGYSTLDFRTRIGDATMLQNKIKLSDNIGNENKTDSFFNDADVMFPNDDIRGGYAVTDVNGKQIGRVKMSYVDESTIKIDEVVSEKRGERTGNGSAIMKMVAEIADKNNVKLTLTPNLIGEMKAKGFETSDKLKSFYEKFGFVKDKGKATMTREPIAKTSIPEDVKLENIQKATPEDLQAEFQKIKEKNDARTTTAGITEIPTRPTGGVPSELESATKPFRTNESTDGEVSAINEWAKSKYASDGELDAEYGTRGLAKYKQTREEFLRSRFCK